LWSGRCLLRAARREHRECVVVLLGARTLGGQLQLRALRRDLQGGCGVLHRQLPERRLRVRSAGGDLQRQRALLLRELRLRHGDVCVLDHGGRVLGKRRLLLRDMQQRNVRMWRCSCGMRRRDRLLLGELRKRHVPVRCNERAVLDECPLLLGELQRGGVQLGTPRHDAPWRRRKQHHQPSIDVGCVRTPSCTAV